MKKWFVAILEGSLAVVTSNPVRDERGCLFSFGPWNDKDGAERWALKWNTHFA